MWYQLLVGDVTREMHPGWVDELEEAGAPREQVELIRRCVGARRPKDAGELLPLLRVAQAPRGEAQNRAAAPEPDPISEPAAEDAPPPAPLSGGRSSVKVPGPSTAESERSRNIRFATGLRQLLGCHQVVAKWRAITWQVMLAVSVGLPAGFFGASGIILPFKESLSDGALAAACVLLGLAIIGGSVWLGIWFRRKARRSAEEALASKIDQLLAEFPQECQTWGGRAALADREIVKEIFRELETPQR